MGQAAYQQGEVLRLRGEFDAAETAYREASRLGREPQPGLALLRLAQGNVGAAAASIRRALGEAAQPLKRAALLPAYVEIALAAEDVGGRPSRLARARRRSPAVTEATPWWRRRLRPRARSGWPRATRTPRSPRRAVPGTCGRSSRPRTRPRAPGCWWAWPAGGWATRTRPHSSSRPRGEAFVELGAAPDLASLSSLTEPPEPGDTGGLTARELEVLRLVAAGRSNREIAAALTISEHTAARHLQNIFAKLHVSSRTAASAFAFEHHLV